MLDSPHELMLLHGLAVGVGRVCYFLADDAFERRGLQRGSIILNRIYST